MVNILYDSANKNFIYFWDNNRQQITSLIADKKVRCLSFALETNLGRYETQQCGIAKHRYILNLYEDEEYCYSICIDNYSEGIICKPTEILSPKGYNTFFGEVAQRILADSEAIKDCKLQDLEQYRI